MQREFGYLAQAMRTYRPWRMKMTDWEKNSAVSDFYSYVHPFYNRDSSLYPFDCCDYTLEAACRFVAEAGINRGTFGGDTYDREKVRAALESQGYRPRATTKEQFRAEAEAEATKLSKDPIYGKSPEFIEWVVHNRKHCLRAVEDRNSK